MRCFLRAMISVGCWVIACALICALLFAPRAFAQLTRIITSESPTKNRLNVLVIRGGQSGLDLMQLQRRLDDLAWVYHVPMTKSKGGVIEGVDDWLSAQTWDVVYFDFEYLGLERSLDLAVDSEAARNMVARMVKSGAIGIGSMVNPSRATDSDEKVAAYNGRLRRMLTEAGVFVFDGAGAEALADEMMARVSAKKGQSLVISIESRKRLSRLLEVDGSLADPLSLPEPSRRDAVVFQGGAGGSGFNLHPYIAFHDGLFWCVWASGSADSTVANQGVRFATSKDGVVWSPGIVLAEDPDGSSGPWQWVASGLSVIDGNLTAFATLHRGRFQGDVWSEARVERFVWSEDRWIRQGVFAKDCLIYYPPLRVAGRDVVVWRSPNAQFSTAVRKAGAMAWEIKPLPGPFPDYRMSEATHYLDPEGRVHLIIRDQGASGFVYHTVSDAGGEVWAVPSKTNLPDAMSKNYADRLSIGWYYFINNSKNSGAHPRDCLTIVFSQDGWSYGQPKLLRKDAPAVRHAGGAKITHSYQHAHAIEQAGRLWVAYATNMEDIEVSSYALEDFRLK